jgi:hypothetical protein
VPEVRSAVFSSLHDLKDWLDDNNDNRRYKKLKDHFKLLEQQIEFNLKKEKRAVMPEKVSMPPGSPIGS